MKALTPVIVLILIFTLVMPAFAYRGRPVNTPTPTATTLPPTATPPPEPTEPPDTGELYGDLYVILRDENGVPILSTQGCIQPISAVTDSTIIATIDGDLLISVLEGEPFGLPTYIDAVGDLVECELTEDMADWVQSVDFGRLNLGRAPDGVIAHAFDEAINKMNVAISIQQDAAGRLVLMVPDEEDPTLYVEKTIDAPAENLALYIEMMKYGDWITENTDPITQGGPPDEQGPPEGDGPSEEPRPVLNASAIALLNNLGFYSLGVSDTIVALNNNELLLAASLLAAAADKTGNITLDKLVYINSIYGINQLGSLPGEVEGKTYYDFSLYAYDRTFTYTGRGDPECGLGWIWVLQPEKDALGMEIPNHFVTVCMEILGYEAAHDPAVNAVHFLDMAEGYTTVPLIFDFIDNARGFTQACDDALQVIEYIHNYKVPEVLYP